jgi:hypothetical protein
MASSIEQKKKKVMGKIAASKKVADGKYSKFKEDNNEALESMKNTKGKIVEFLTDLIAILVGFQMLVNVIVDTFTYYLGKIETQIKKALKTQLKSIVSCGINPSIPDFLKDGGVGIIIEVKKIDFLDIFLIDPTTNEGQLIYNDVTPTFLNSSDFNTYLYGVIQNPGTAYPWPIINSVLNIKFTDNNTSGGPNNILTINAHPNYNLKTLNDLNSNFIDTLSLFNTQNLLTRILDTIYGSVSFSLKFSKKRLIKEEQINTVIDKIIDAESNDIIDDTYFTFTNDETDGHEVKASLRRKGVRIVDTSNKAESSVPVAMISDMKNDLMNAVSTLDRKKVLSKHLNTIAEQTAQAQAAINTGNAAMNEANAAFSNANNAFSNVKNMDKPSLKLNFTQQIFNFLTKGIVSSIISPRVIMIFLINLKIVYGQDAVYEDGVDFIKKNKNIFKAIIKEIVVMIIKILLAIALKKIAKLVADAMILRRIEKQMYRELQASGLIAPNIKFREFKKSLDN